MAPGIPPNISQSELYMPRLYVLEVENFGVKIGISSTPRKRFMDHKRTVERARPTWGWNLGLGRAWISEPRMGAIHFERDLKKSLGGFMNVNEWLKGVGFETAIDHAKKLVSTAWEGQVADLSIGWTDA